MSEFSKIKIRFAELRLVGPAKFYLGFYNECTQGTA